VVNKNTNSFTREMLHFMTFICYSACDFISDRSIASYSEIF